MKRTGEAVLLFVLVLVPLLTMGCFRASDNAATQNASDDKAEVSPAKSHWPMTRRS